MKCNEKIAELTDITRPMLRDAVEAVNKVCLSFLLILIAHTSCSFILLILDYYRVFEIYIKK